MLCHGKVSCNFDSNKYQYEWFVLILFVDIHFVAGEEGGQKKGKNKRPLKVDLILQSNSHIPTPKE